MLGWGWVWGGHLASASDCSECVRGGGRCCAFVFVAVRKLWGQLFARNTNRCYFLLPSSVVFLSGLLLILAVREEEELDSPHAVE